MRGGGGGGVVADHDGGGADEGGVDGGEEVVTADEGVTAGEFSSFAVLPYAPPDLGRDF